MAINKALFTSTMDAFLTPPYILDLVEKVGPIDLDPCPHDKAESSRRARINLSGDGLAVGWEEHQTSTGITFVNPPYGRALSKWAEKMAAEKHNAIIALVPARVETRWWATMNPIAWCAVRGRIKFYDAKGCETVNSAPFPSAICLLHAHSLLSKFTATFSKIGTIYLPAVATS